MYKFIIYLILSLLGLVLTILVVFAVDNYFNKSKDLQFIEGINLSEYKSLHKTRGNLHSVIQEDSISNAKVSEDKIEVFGTGYAGYDFYIWHKPYEIGSIFIKAFEISNNQILSEHKLFEETNIFIEEKSLEFKFFKRSSIIYEGPLGKYYPVRFELWFKCKSAGKDRKLAQAEYLIDGWDR